MDLLIEKGDKRTYLSRYKVITTSFEESSPSIKRNNTHIQYRNGNVDFGGWHEAKTIDYVGYYQADDLEDEEYLRERIYALLSDPDGYYITQLKNDNDNSFERPGETSGDYFDKQVNRPSHKRFYVYASSLESELVGSYGGHVLYKISAKFTTMKLPYGESVQRDLDVKPNVPYYGRNLIVRTGELVGQIVNIDGSIAPYYQATLTPAIISVTPSEQLTMSGTEGGDNIFRYAFYDGTGKTLMRSFTDLKPATTVTAPAEAATFRISYPRESQVKLERGNIATDWSPAPEDTEYNAWYTKTYYNTNNLFIPYAGTVPCNQLEQGFTVEFTAKEAGSNLKISLNGVDFIAAVNVSSGDVFKLSGYEYLRNGISIVKSTNKAYFKLLPGVTNKISSSLAGKIRILDYQDLYA